MSHSFLLPAGDFILHDSLVCNLILMSEDPRTGRLSLAGGSPSPPGERDSGKRQWLVTTHCSGRGQRSGPEAAAAFAAESGESAAAARTPRFIHWTIFQRSPHNAASKSFVLSLDIVAQRKFKIGKQFCVDCNYS